MERKHRETAIRWGAIAVALVILLLVVPVGVFTAAPVGCLSCHDGPEFTALPESSAHADVACASCHIGPGLPQRVRFASYQAFGMMVRIVDTSDTAVSRIGDDVCTSCHDQLGGLTESAGLRVRHDSCAQGSSCVSCHSAAAHLEGVSWPTGYSMERCLSCHSTREVSQSCDSCHVGKLDRTVPATGTFAVTHGPNWERTHGMGDIATCSACHTDDDFCVRCHGLGVPHTPRFTNVHSTIATDARAKCLSCHEQAFCGDCHVYEMPHPESFVPEHPSIVERDGEAGCGMCHEKIDCTSCHEMHVHPGGAGPLPPIRGSRL